MFFSSKKVIGLDIGTSSIKIAELEVGRGAPVLESFLAIPTPDHAINGGEIAKASALVPIVVSALKQIKSNRKYASVGLWGTSVIVKKITIPKIDKKMVQEQLKWEAEQYIPFDINDVVLDFHLLPTSESPETLDVVLVAAQREIVLQYNSLISDVGLKTGVVDVNGFALSNLFEANYGKFPGESVALLNIGAGITNFVVVNNGETVFSRDIPIGGLTYTNEIHKELGITISEAEALKLSLATGGEVPDQVHSVVGATNQSVTEEIRNSFEFFAASSVGAQISQCFFTGGASLTPGAIEQMAQTAGVQFQPLNPFQKIKPSKKFPPQFLQNIAPIAAVSMGLGLRKVDE